MPVSPRIRRLRTDHRAMEKIRAESSIVEFSCAGDPPNSYRIRFRGNGLARSDATGRVQVRETHDVRVELGASYPRQMPQLTWETPIFHPNISGSGAVCLGGFGTYWVPSLNLDELCEMLWDMIRYKNFDVESPYNRDAAAWAKTQTQFRLPVDPRSVRDKVAAQREPQAPAGPTAPPVIRAEPADAEVLFLDDDVVQAELAGADDDDILIIE